MCTKILFSSLAKIFVTTMRRLVSAIISLFNYISYIKKALYIRLKIIITIILVELKHNFLSNIKKSNIIINTSKRNKKLNNLY